MMFDALESIRLLITEACRHYQKSAPTVVDYLDDLYIRIDERPTSVRLTELLSVEKLKEEGIWEHPNYAANRVYHLMSDLGMDTTGAAGF